MSPSTRSKPGSESSPETGDAPEATSTAPAPPSSKAAVAPKASGPVEIGFEVSWQHVAGWAAFELVLGALLLWKLGTVGKWVGVVLIVRGVFRGYELFQMLTNPPGTIVVSEQRVVLPRGLSLGKPIEVKPADISAVYFLRRSVPWNRSAPVLVVEVGTHAMAFPRDWFASEADQRHVIHALMSVMPKDAARPATSPPAFATSTKMLWAQIIGGVVLLAGGIGGAMSSADANTPAHPIWVAPIVVGFILCWRALTRW